MLLVSLPGWYDGTLVHLHDPRPALAPAPVHVTFVAPLDEPGDAAALTAFWASFGAWKDDDPPPVAGPEPDESA